MTPQWPTCFKWHRILILAIACAPAFGLAVEGSIDRSPKAERPHAHEQNDSDIVVWLEPVRPERTVAVKPQRAQLLQKNKMFHPHILVVTAGSTVDFPNADPIFHNAFSTFDGQIFDVGLYPPGSSRPVRFRRPGIVRVFCNIHPSMSAVIIVLDTPYFTKAAPNGRYRLENLPPGVYELHVFDERATAGREPQLLLTVDASQPETVAAPVHLSEAGYVHLPHKNKYGQDYRPASLYEDTYTGPPK